MNKIFQLDFSYEYDLYNQQSSNAYNKFLEPLFIFSESSDLRFSSNVRYSDSYQDFIFQLIEKKLFVSTETGHQRQIPWWGVHGHTDIAKKLNSKLWCYEYIFNSSHQEIVLAKNIEDLEHYSKERGSDFFIKELLNVAGRGNSISQNKKDISFPAIVEPIYQRVLDIGCFLSSKGESLFHISYNTKLGAPIGLVCLPQKTLPGFLREKGISDHLLQKYFSHVEDIQQSIVAEGGQYPYSFDSFFYHDESGEIDLYPLTDLNYRKSLGHVLHELSQRFFPEKPTLLIKLNRKSLNGLPSQEIFSSSHLTSIGLSPKEFKFQYFLISSPSINYLEEFISSQL